jgi:hypothetical protein
VCGPCLCRHGLNARAKRLSLVAGYAALLSANCPELLLAGESTGELEQQSLQMDSFWAVSENRLSKPKRGRCSANGLAAALKGRE